MSNEKLVRILINKEGVLIRAGDPSFTTKEIDREILKIVKEGGHVKNVPYEEYSKMKLYEKINPLTP